MCILDWFLKEHDISNDAEKSMHEINYILKYIQTEKHYFKLHLYFTILLFYWSFDRNAAQSSWSRTFEWYCTVCASEVEE